MTCVTINLETLEAKFHADAEAGQAYADKNDLALITKPEDLGELSGSQLVNFYNHLVDRLNANGNCLSHVNRFSTKEAAVKRIMANLMDLWEDERQKAKAAPAPVDQITVKYTSVDGYSETKKFKTIDGARRFATKWVGNNPEIGSAYAVAADGIGKVTVQGTTLKELFAAPTEKAAPAKASSEPRKETWRRVKHEEPSKTAYLPKPGSVQDGLYKILTAEPTITMEDYCEQASKLDTRDKTLFTPAQVWGALRYLFVVKRGYGLDFDGTNLQLIRPTDERPAGEQK